VPGGGQGALGHRHRREHRPRVAEGGSLRGEPLDRSLAPEKMIENERNNRLS